MDSTPAHTPERLSYTVAEAAAACGVTDYAMRRALAEGRIAHSRFGKTIVIDAQSLREYVRSGAGKPVAQRHGISAASRAR